MLAYAMLTLSLTGIGFIAGAIAQGLYQIIDGSVLSIAPECLRSLRWRQLAYDRVHLCGDLSRANEEIVIIHGLRVLEVASPGKITSRRLRLKIARLHLDLVKLDGQSGKAIKAYIQATNPNRDAILHIMKRAHIAHEIIN